MAAIAWAIIFAVTAHSATQYEIAGKLTEETVKVLGPFMAIALVMTVVSTFKKH